MTTMGKFRHLSRCTTPEGHFVIMALDHRDNLLAKLNQHAPTPLTDDDFASFKQMVITALAPHASAVLTDPAYGIGSGIVSQAISGKIGLLAPIEVTDYDLHPSKRSMKFIPDWSVEKIKRVGGDGVKLLLPYHPEAADVEQKHAVVQQIVEDCARYDIPFFLEPIPYSPDPETSLPNAELLQITVEMCRAFSAMQVDVLKLLFPVDHKQSQDENEWRTACQQVNAACNVPWALLSAGVGYEMFARQVEIACSAGASGVIVGRAVWSDLIERQGDERHEFLESVAIPRMQQLAGICAAKAVPWFTRTSAPESGTDWYTHYSG